MNPKVTNETSNKEVQKNRTKAKNQQIPKDTERTSTNRKETTMKTNNITNEAQDTNNINDCYHNNTPTIYDGTAHEPATLPETGIFTDRTYTAPDGTTSTYRTYEGPIYPAKYLGANYRDSNKDSLLLCTSTTLPINDHLTTLFPFILSIP